MIPDARKHQSKKKRQRKKAPAEEADWQRPVGETAKKKGLVKFKIHIGEGKTSSEPGWSSYQTGEAVAEVPARVYKEQQQQIAPVEEEKEDTLEDTDPTRLREDQRQRSKEQLFTSVKELKQK